MDGNGNGVTLTVAIRVPNLSAQRITSPGTSDFVVSGKESITLMANPNKSQYLHLGSDMVPKGPANAIST